MINKEYLKKDFNSKNTSKPIIHLSKELIPVRVNINRILQYVIIIIEQNSLYVLNKMGYKCDFSGVNWRLQICVSNVGCIWSSPSFKFVGLRMINNFQNSQGILNFYDDIEIMMNQKYENFYLVNLHLHRIQYSNRIRSILIDI